jgi:hypothetical protein
MKVSTPFRVSALSILLGTLVACSGGGGSSSSSTAAGSTTTLSGKVIDGYIIGATVCLDVNSNNRCDAGEPTTTSMAGGAYTLPAYTGSIAGLQVIAEVGPTARDEDDGGALIGAGNTYSLLAPAAASATVTPLSTLVSSAIAAGGGESQVSIGEALSNVSAQFGIPVAALVANDYKASTSATNTATAAVAKATATALAQVTNTLKNNGTVAANLTDGQIIQQAILSVKSKVLPQILSDGQLTPTAAASSAAIVNAVTTAVNAEFAGPKLAGNIQNIVVASQSGSGSVVSAESFFRTGLMVVQDSSGDYINAAGNRVNGYYGGYTNATDAEFIRYDAAANVDIMKRYVLVGNRWFLPFENGEDWTFDGTNWVLSLNVSNSAPNANPNARPIFEQNCVSFPENPSGTVLRKYCAVEKKLDGQLMTKLIPGMCTRTYTGVGPQILSTCTTATFPTGSSGYDLTSTTVSKLTGTYNGLFKLWARKDNSWSGYGTGANQSSGTIFDFIEYTKTNMQFIGSGCNTPFKILSYNTSTKEGKVQWGSRTNDCNTAGSYQFQAVETSDFKVIAAGGKDIFIVPTPATFRARNSSSDQPYLIFARQTSSNNVSGIWSGAYYPVNFKGSIPFTGDPATNSQIVSPTLFNAVLIQQGITPYPYTGQSSSGTYTGNIAP